MKALLKKWSEDFLRPDEKCFCMYMKPQHSVLMMCPLFSVLVLWMNYQIYCFFFLPYPSYLPDIVDTKFTRGSNCIHRITNRLSVEQHCTATPDYFFLIALSSVGFVRRAIMWSDLHLGNFLGNGYWVVMLSTVVCPLPPNVILLLMYVL